MLEIQEWVLVLVVTVAVMAIPQRRRIADTISGLMARVLEKRAGGS